MYKAWIQAWNSRHVLILTGYDFPGLSPSVSIDLVTKLYQIPYISTVKVVPIGGIFLIWKLIIPLFPNSLLHSKDINLCSRLFEKKDIVNFHIKKIPPIGTTFTVEMYNIWYNSDTRYLRNARYEPGKPVTYHLEFRSV